MNTDRLPSIPAEEYHTASRSGRTCRADCWPTAGTSTVALAKADANPTDLCRRKTCGEIAEGKSPALALGRQLGRAGSQEPGDVARLRSVGCRAGAARNYAVADLTEKAKRGCVSPDSTDEEIGEPGHVARLRSFGCRAGAAPELRRGRFNRKGETHPRFAFSVKSGGAYRGRTDDLLHAMQAL